MCISGKNTIRYSLRSIRIIFENCSCTLRVNGFYSFTSLKKGKTKDDESSSSYGVKKGLSLALVRLRGRRSVLGGRVLSLVRVGAFSPYCVSPTRLSFPSGACSGLSRLLPPGESNVRDCPGALDARSCATAPNGTNLPRTTCPRSWRGSTSPGWIGVATK